MHNKLLVILKKIFLLFTISLISLSARSNSLDTLLFRQQEKMLVSVYAQIADANPVQKAQYELAFRDSLLKVLKLKDVQSYTFDSLNTIGKIISKDKNLIIYSWNIPQSGGFNNYYCIVQYYLKKDKKYTTTLLKEKVGFLNQNNQAMALPTSWAGVLYYKIITTKTKGQTYYTLLGFDFNNLTSNRKTIDLIKFDEFGIMSFLSNRFLYEGKRQNRIVFEYAERVQMTLNYNKKEKIIYFDHLSPFRPSLQDQYQFYGPDLSYDGFEFKDGIWIHKSDIQPEF